MSTKHKGRVLGAPKRTLGEIRTPTKPCTSITENDTFQSPTRNGSQNGSTPSTATDLSDKLQSPFKGNTPDIILTHIDAIEDDRVIGMTPSPSPVIQDDKKDDQGGEYLFCPICDEKMISLLQLNRHLDDIHSTTEESISTSQQQSSSKTLSVVVSPNEELRSWLKKGNEVRSKIQQNLPKKFVNLDIFDNNTTFGISDSSRDSSSNSLSTLTPEIQVTRKHWRKPSGYDICSAPGCKKRLNIRNGVVNCRKCGDLYCHDHTIFRAKLNVDAHFDPNGAWCRCCEKCYKQRPGYDDIAEFVVLTGSFAARRQQRLNEKQLYINKLEKRIVNLTQRLNKIDREYSLSEFQNNFLRFKINSRKKEVEKQLVQWEDENFVLNCFLCLKNFSFTLRKHHCRLCGRVVCGSEETGCSKEIQINVLTGLLSDVPKVNDEQPLRICRACKDVLFIKRNFLKDLKKPLTSLLAKFESQQNIKKVILLLMPKFQDMITRLQNEKNLKNRTIINNASTMRKRLLDSFAIFERLTKEIIAIEPDSEDEKRLQLAIQTESASFIQRNTSPLKQLPRILKQIEEQDRESTPPRLTEVEIQQIKANREELMVLNEQKFLVEDMLETCKKQRRFDEVPTLTENLNELSRKIEQLQLELGNEGF